MIFLIYLVIRYGPFITRIFEERPMFLPLRVTPEDLGEPVSFTDRRMGFGSRAPTWRGGARTASGSWSSATST